MTIVAAFQVHLAAAIPAVDAPVMPAVAALAERLGVDPSREPTRFIADITRLLHPTPDAIPQIYTDSPQVVGRARATAVRVPVPLSAETWSRAVFRKSVPVDQLVGTILSDRRAALLCRGLSGVDDDTLAYLEQHPSILSFLYERAAGTFSAFGDNLRIRDRRVVPPGGAAAAPLWEAVVLAPLGDPDRFIKVLFGEFEGRLAYLYDAVAAADVLPARFAFGFWIQDEAARVQRFKALAAAVATSYHEWNLPARPFTRPLGDLSVLLLRIRLQPSGAPAAPDDRAFWAEVFDVGVSATGAVAPETPTDRSHGPIDAAWLVDATGDGDMYTRTDRLDQFAFGQRVFDTEPADPTAATALRAFRQRRMLLLTLERLGIRSPSVYINALARAEDLVSGDDDHRFWTLAQFQGSLGLLARMQRVATLTTAISGPRAASLVAVPVRDGEYEGGIAAWMRTELAPVLPEGPTWEARLIAALSGPSETGRSPRMVWEGQAYRVDLAHAESQRLAIVREKQEGHTLDLAFEIDELAVSLRKPALTLDEMRAAVQEIRRIATESARQLRRPVVNLMPPGVDAPPDGVVWMNEIANELLTITRAQDIRRAARVGLSLQQLADITLGNALASLAYAADIGDPDGAPLLAGNVALRHDFGLGRRDGESRQRVPWAMPRQTFQPGVPWHISGSLLGLDIALAPLNLRRLTLDRVADAPKISSIEREAFAVGITLMDPRRMKDEDRDAIADAIARGQQRVAAMMSGQESLDTLAELLGFDGLRRRGLAWSLLHEPETVGTRFSLVELLTLGGGAAGADLDAWGTPGLYMDGCVCTRFPTARAWTMLEGRPQLPMMAATMGDLNLAIAVMLRDLKIPAALARPILSVGMQEFIDELSAIHSGDWWSLSRQARGIEKQQMEDYVSAAAAVNGPLVPDEPAGTRHQP